MPALYIYYCITVMTMPQSRDFPTRGTWPTDFAFRPSVAHFFSHPTDVPYYSTTRTVRSFGLWRERVVVALVYHTTNTSVNDRRRQCTGDF